RARHVAAREHESVAAGREAVDAVVQQGAPTGKALEGPQLEELVEEERGRLVGRRAGASEERERRVERRARADRSRRRGIGDGERRHGGDGAQKAFRRRGGAL